MGREYKVLGQANPAANTDAMLYTVPGGTSAVVSTITVCNQAAAIVKVRVAVRPGGAALAPLHYQAFDTDVQPNDTLPLTFGVTLAATDVITVRAASSTVSFSAFGAQITGS